MARLYLVRHGEASAAWNEAADPGLSALGRQQAEIAAADMASLGPMEVLSSPLMRARETAEPTARLWRRTVAIADQIAEIPSPAGLPIAERQEWLLTLLQKGWRGAGELQRAWRDTLLDFLSTRKADAVIFSHFVAINVAVGAALGRDDIICFRPANASITVIDTTAAGLSLIKQGGEAKTRVR